MNERDEMAAEEASKQAAREEALSEALRMLPSARGWAVFAIMQDGNPAIMVSAPQYADAVAIAHVGGQTMQAHINKFRERPTQEF